MAKYCLRCGRKLPLLGYHVLLDGEMCNECIDELGLSKNKKNLFYAFSGTYEMLLSEARLQDPESVNKIPGERNCDDMAEPVKLPTIRTINQILDEDCLIENPRIQFQKNEKCYYDKTLELTCSTGQKVQTGGGIYKRGLCG